MFNTEDPISVILNLTSSDLDYTRLIQPNLSTKLTANTDRVYRFRYDDFKGYDLTIKWNGNGTLPVYIADTCSFYLTENDPNVLAYKRIARRGSFVIPAATIDSWAANVGEDGYLYAAFENTASSTVIFMTDKPAEEDPE
jgi:hypothetical protein